MAKISRRAVAPSPSDISYSVLTRASGSALSAGNGAPAPLNGIANVNMPGKQEAAEDSAFATSSTVHALHDANNKATQSNTAPPPSPVPTQSYNKYTPYTARPTYIGGSRLGLPPATSAHMYNKTIQEQIRAEFFATYDVMTGIRIAATLSGFFGLMVFLIVWKSRSSSNETLKVLKDPKMAAVAAVCMQEEEEREIQEAMVATGMSIYPDEYDAIVYRRQRMLSLGNVSAPPMLNRGYRFSSVGGGYSSLLEPPRRFSYSAASAGSATGSISGSRRKSGSESSRILTNYPMGSSFGTDDYFVETEDETEPAEYRQHGQQFRDANSQRRTDSTRSKHGLLEVPLMGQDSRRSSAMTCCSTESSYLERRCSAFTLGLSNLPPSLQRKLSTASRTSSPDNWDYFYPDIHIIQATPNPSPCPSERSIYEQLNTQPETAAAVTHILNNLMTTTTSKTAKSNTANNRDRDRDLDPLSALHVAPPLNTAAAPKIVRKHSIAYYDLESAQAGRKQQIHSISADTVDMYPYNQPAVSESNVANASSLLKRLQTALPVSIHQGYRKNDASTDELRINAQRKAAVVELQRNTRAEQVPSMPATALLAYENNNSYPYTASPAAVAAVGVGAAATMSATTANSSSLSIDSTPQSLDKLNGSGSLGTVSVKALFNADKRAPLASLSSFKISSLEYPDSEMRSLDEDSVFLDSVADTDEDMQQLSSDSEEASLGNSHHACKARGNGILVATAGTGTGAVGAGGEGAVAALALPSGEQTPVSAATLTGYTSSNAMRQAQACKQPLAPDAALHPADNLARKAMLQRHSTISASSTDRISLIGQQIKEFTERDQAMGTPATIVVQQSMPLETHFGALIATNSPPAHPRRAQLFQQYSDPPSLPTTTNTATTTDETCSTLNTEIGGISPELGGNNSTAGTISGSGSGGGLMCADGGSSTTQTQYSSLTTVISFEPSSPQTEAVGQMSSPCPAVRNFQSQTQTKQSLAHDVELSQVRSRDIDEGCMSSRSDSMIHMRQPLICMPSSLKNLILRGSNSAERTSKAPPISKSASNLSQIDACDILHMDSTPAIALELPLIKLPTGESSDSSLASMDNDIPCAGEKEVPCDPSLPVNSRKWSKETLF